MRNKTFSRAGLFLMELIISILFFSLTGAVCVRLFVNAHIVSRDSVELNHALEWTQNVAEVFYGLDGNREEMIQQFENVCLDGNEKGDEVFYLLFDSEFAPLALTEEQRMGKLSDIDYDYLITVEFSNEKELLLCHIQTNKAGEETEALEQEPVYELSVSLFPLKEGSYGN